MFTARVSRLSQVPLLLGLFIAAGAAVIPGMASAEFDFNKANDYYDPTSKGGIAVVDQFHITKCEQKAIGDCIFILNIFPNHPKALLLMAQACEQPKTGPCKMDEIFARAIAINPGISATFVVQGIYFHRARRYPQAIESFKEAINLNPNSINAHYDLGLAYLEAKQYDLANEQAQAAYALGAPLPGLRNRLEQVGRWKPLEQKQVPQAVIPAPESPGTVAPGNNGPNK